MWVAGVALGENAKMPPQKGLCGGISNVQTTFSRENASFAITESNVNAVSLQTM